MRDKENPRDQVKSEETDNLVKYETLDEILDYKKDVSKKGII
jgi:hypothetical protein